MDQMRSNLLELMPIAGLFAIQLINKDKPFFLEQIIADLKGVPLWVTPEMNLQSYYSPINEKSIPVYSGGEIIALVT